MSDERINGPTNGHCGGCKWFKVYVGMMEVHGSCIHPDGGRKYFCRAYHGAPAPLTPSWCPVRSEKEEQPRDG